MAKKKAVKKIAATTKPSAPASSTARQSPPAEARYSAELAFLEAFDSGMKPAGWKLSPSAVVTFICGSGKDKLKRKVAKGSDQSDLPSSMAISEKFVGNRAIVERCGVTLAGERGLLLVGEPGTALSLIHI